MQNLRTVNKTELVPTCPALCSGILEGGDFPATQSVNDPGPALYRPSKGKIRPRKKGDPTES
jgi:hypothetical protein